ncbi:MAG: helix-turn-helix domain-containing protein [Bacilli bacterium]|jgi:DNA-binding transcriptional regulator LsrR (DeoR family)|nr:helix-turn-helix domain-containing protein [Bacilli bacterium]
MPKNNDALDILKIAKMYYVDGLSQQEISERTFIDRSQISRILKTAREEGLVNISISLPNDQEASVLEKEIKDGLGLEKVMVAPRLVSGEDQSKALYFFAARFLDKIIPSYKRIGIGLGKTLYNVAGELSPSPLTEKIDFYSVAGSAGTDNTYLQASVLLDNFSSHFHGTSHYNNFAICQKKSLMSEMALKRYKDLLQAYKSLDLVITSIGGPFNKSYPYLEEFALSKKELDLQECLKAPHGNLLGHVFFQDGTIMLLPEDYVITSMSPKLLVNTPEVICIANSSSKVQAIISAAKQKYIKTLITDEPTGEEIKKVLSQ